MSCKTISDNGTTDLGVSVPDGVVDAAIDLAVGEDEISSDIAQEGARQKLSSKVRVTIKKNGTGTGGVKSFPSGIDCGGSCEMRHTRGMQIALIAIPDPGSVFIGWSRNGCPGGSQEGAFCTWDNWKSRDVVVTFDKKPPKPSTDRGYHWFAGDGKVARAVGDNLTGVWRDENLLNGAIAQWNGSPVVDLKKSNGRSSCKQDTIGIHGRIEVCNRNYGGTLPESALGIGRIVWKGEHIHQGVVLLDDFYFQTKGSVYNTPAWRKMVICQELGHTLGLTATGFLKNDPLTHRDTTSGNKNLGTCLDYTNHPEGGSISPDEPGNLQPDKEDFRQLDAIYDHKDDINNIFNRQSPFDDRFLKVKPSPNNMGRLILSSPDGRVKIYEKDYGQGRKITTHVLRAPKKNRR